MLSMRIVPTLIEDYCSILTLISGITSIPASYNPYILRQYFETYSIEWNLRILRVNRNTGIIKCTDCIEIIRTINNCAICIIIECAIKPRRGIF